MTLEKSINYAAHACKAALLLFYFSPRRITLVRKMLLIFLIFNWASTHPSSLHCSAKPVLSSRISCLCTSFTFHHHLQSCQLFRSLVQWESSCNMLCYSLRFSFNELLKTQYWWFEITFIVFCEQLSMAMKSEIFLKLILV